MQPALRFIQIEEFVDVVPYGLIRLSDRSEHQAVNDTDQRRIDALTDPHFLQCCRYQQNRMAVLRNIVLHFSNPDYSSQFAKGDLGIDDGMPFSLWDTSCSSISRKTVQPSAGYKPNGHSRCDMTDNTASAGSCRWSLRSRISAFKYRAAAVFGREWSRPPTLK